MKKTLLLLIVLLALCLALAACGAAPEEAVEEATEEAAGEVAEEVTEEAAAGLVESDLNPLTYVMIDPATTKMDAYNAEALDGSWTMDVHICDQEDDVEQYGGYFNKALTSDSNTELESGELQLENYTWQYERHVANGQNFGTFFTVLDPPQSMPDNYGDVYAVYCYLWMEDFASMDDMAQIIGTLTFRDEEKAE